MKKNLLTVGLLAASFSLNAQVLTYVGNGGLVTVTNDALVYNGGGFQVAAASTTDKGVVNNMGDIMVVGISGDKFLVEPNADFRLQFDETNTNKEVYGQLYINGIPQANITGKVNKDFIADANNGETGRQQTALPFYNYTIGDLKTTLPYIQTTVTSLNSAGRFNYASVFRWNNKAARFDQIAGSDATVVGKPTDYFIQPRRNSAGTIIWKAAEEKSTFTGTPVSDVDGGTNSVVLDITTVASFGTNGSGVNRYYERYNSYLNDPFRNGGSGVPVWDADYGKNLSQVANPFLTNIDLANIVNNSYGTGFPISNIEGIAYYGSSNLVWNYNSGTTYTNPNNIVIAKTNGGNTPFQAGDVNKMLIKPMKEVMIKFSNSTPTTINFNPTRRFAQTARTAPYGNVTTARMAGANIPADLLVKQVAVVLYNGAGNEVARTYYAVSPSATTGASSSAKLQGFVDNYFISTREELATGGEDTSKTYQLYINEANEVDFEGKEIPLKINYSDVATLKFEVYEGGQLVADRGNLSNGKSFYIMKDKVLIKINNGDTMPVSGTSYGLFYESPTGKSLGNANVAKGNTVIAKRDNDWVVRFADSWKSADVEVYSATGQLLHSVKSISTASDYVIPMNQEVKGLYLVKTISETGEVVIKKIVK